MAVEPCAATSILPARQTKRGMTRVMDADSAQRGLPRMRRARAWQAGAWCVGTLAVGAWMPSQAQPLLGAQAPVPPRLESVVILGRSGVPAERLQAAVADLQGQPMDEALLERVRLTVAAAHDAAGLRLVSVDRPLAQGGVLLVRVHALRVARIAVLADDGTTDGSAAGLEAVHAALPALREGESPNLDVLDQQLRLANLQPHRRWALDFRPVDAPAAPAAPPAPTQPFDSQPGQTIASAQDTPRTQPPPGRPRLAPRDVPPPLEARVRVEGDGAFYGRALLDNAGQEATGRERLRMQLGHGDLFGAGRSLDLTAMTSLRQPSRQHQFALRYQQPLPAWSSLLSVELQSSRSRPGRVNDYFDVAGNSDGGVLALRRLLPRVAGLEPYAEVALEYAVHEDVIDFSGTNLGGRVGMAPLALALGATWQSGPWRAFGQVQWRHNTGWGAHSSAADYARARAQAPVHWNSLQVAAELRRAQGAGQEWVLRAQGQWSDDALVPAQQMRTGGAILVRGLEESELSGDRGLALATEYWWPLGAGHRWGLMLDAAALHRQAPQAGEARSASAVTAGLGWQWQPNAARGPRLSAALGQVLRERHLPVSRRGDRRLHLQLDWPF